MSAPVSAIAQGVQIGVETTEGTAVAANKRLQALSINLSPTIETDPFRPMGSKFPTIISLGKDYAEGDLDGRATYNEIVYVLSACLSYAAPTMIGATDAYLWTFAPNPSSPDTTKSLTVEWGRSGASNARKCAGVYVNEFGLEWSRDGVVISGSVVGRNVLKGQTLTGSPTTLEPILVLPTQIDVYMDSTWAGLGTTKLLDVTAGAFNIGDRFSPWWTLNSALSSFAAKVESEPSTDLSIRMAANSTGYAYLDDIRAGAKKFIRIEAIGPDADTGEPYRLTADFCAQYNAAAGEDEDEGALVLEAPMTITTDATSGKALQFEVVNLLTGL
jgi:hypothetical protein